MLSRSTAARACVAGILAIIVQTAGSSNSWQPAASAPTDMQQVTATLEQHVQPRRGLLQSLERHHSRAHGVHELPNPLQGCQAPLAKMTPAQMHQLQESLQQLHTAYARVQFHKVNWENLAQPKPGWLKDNPKMSEAFDKVYIEGKDLPTQLRLHNESVAYYQLLEQRVKAEVDKLAEMGAVQNGTKVDDLSPCIMRKVDPHHFPDQPQVSLLMRIEQGTASAPDDSIQRIVAAAVSCHTTAPVELVVGLTGAAGSDATGQWAWQSWSSKGLVVPFVDTSQQGTVTFNRMASVARGRILVLMSPDDLLLLSGGTGTGVAPHCEWLRQVLSLYGRVPQLGAMAHGSFSYTFPPQLLSLGGPNGGSAQHFKEATTSLPLQYVAATQGMPVSFRRTAIEEIGWADEDMPGEGGKCAALVDADVSVRLWKAGWRVGAHRLVGAGGALIAAAADGAQAAPRCTDEAAQQAEQLFEARHGKAQDSAMWGAVLVRIKELNIRELQPLAGTSQDLAAKCPMPQGCTV